MSLQEWGWSSVWTERFETHRAGGLAPARVVGVNRGQYDLETETGRTSGELSGRLEYAHEKPVTGDWVAITATDPALVVAIADRQSLFTRAIDGRLLQPLAANIDVAFLVCGLDQDWNPRRLDRYLVLAAEAGVEPVIVLNKSDLCADAENALRYASALARAVLVSAIQDDLGRLLGSFVKPFQTAALLGSSGAGKSTIANALFGSQAQITRPVRDSDSRGRHTTTTRTLIRLPQGWMLLDMPGLRAVGVTGSRQSVDDAFSDVALAAAECRFNDCTHTVEPGCAVLQSVDPDRLANYRKLEREAAHLRRREDPAAARAQKQLWKTTHAQMKRTPNKRN